MGERAKGKYVYSLVHLLLNFLHRFCRWFLSKFPAIEVCEMETIYEKWVRQIYPDSFESEHQCELILLNDKFVFSSSFQMTIFAG